MAESKDTRIARLEEEVERLHRLVDSLLARPVVPVHVPHYVPVWPTYPAGPVWWQTISVSSTSDAMLTVN